MAHENVTLGADIAPLNSALESAAQALDNFTSGPVAETGQRIEAAIGKSFTAVSGTIARAALSGKMSMDQMVNSILSSLQRIAIQQFIIKPIEDLIKSVGSSIFSVGGARAAGGPVTSNTPYLVGEHGPEIFVPTASGSITPNSAIQSARPNIVLHVQARDAQSFLKSEPQLAALMSRALARGQRNL